MTKAQAKPKLTVHQQFGEQRPRVTFTCIGEPMTKQSMRDETNINNIMSKYLATGAIDHANKHAPQYGYASSADFRESLEIIQKGQTMFDELPSNIRTDFNNNPAEFLEFVQNPDNRDEMREYGLIETPTPAEPARVADVSSEPPTPAPPAFPAPAGKDE